MDSALDKKYKKFLNNCSQNKDYKLIQNFLHRIISKPYPTNQRKNKSQKLILSTRAETYISQRNNSIIIIPKRIQYKNKNKFILKKYKSLSVNTINTAFTDTNKSNNENNKLVSPDILKEKSIFLTLRKHFSINSLINTQLIENKERKIQYLRKNISDINIKKKESIPKIEEKNVNKKMTRFALRNNLYFKHSSILSGGQKSIKDNELESKYYYRIKKIKAKTGDDSAKSEQNNAFNFNNIFQRNLNLPNLKINKQIINNDEKISINCLFSKINANLNSNKIFHKNNVKTIFGMQKEKSYKRIHLLDKVFSNLMKNK